MSGELAKERKSHVTTVLTNGLIDRLDAYCRAEKVAKAFVHEIALDRFLTIEEQKKKK